VAPSAPVLDAAPSVQSAPLPAAQVKVPEPAPEKAVSTASKPKEAVSLAPREIEKKQSMKKKTYKRERVREQQMESAIKSVEKQVAATKTDPKQEALDRIRSELEKKEAQQPVEGSATATATTGMIGEGKLISDLQEIYIAEVAYNIQRNWAFSDQLAGENNNLYNEVVIKIQRNGTIADVWFDRRSGNSYFDDSTYKAILKSSPLPPIPDGISGSSLTWGFRFKPGGLK
jgi:colicin import membrane protein